MTCKIWQKASATTNTYTPKRFAHQRQRRRRSRQKQRRSGGQNSGEQRWCCLSQTYPPSQSSTSVRFLRPFRSVLFGGTRGKVWIVILRCAREAKKEDERPQGEELRGFPKQQPFDQLSVSRAAHRIQINYSLGRRDIIKGPIKDWQPERELQKLKIIQNCDTN